MTFRRGHIDTMCVGQSQPDQRGPTSTRPERREGTRRSVFDPEPHRDMLAEGLNPAPD